jgi:tRNA (cmo5U34)-methyltransferase
MNEFDLKAAEWDKNPVHWERSVAIAEEIQRLYTFPPDSRALEFGAGTGILSFLLMDYFREIVLLDSSSEMVKQMDRKILSTGAKNLKTILFDLEHDDLKDKGFDFIFTQMAMHHVTDIENIINKFYNMLNPGGRLAVADLCTEDGSFHGEGFSGHKGFKTDDLANILGKTGFSDITCRKCFVINRKISENETRYFDIFLLSALRP